MGCRGKAQVYGSGDAAYLAQLEADRIAAYGTTAEYYSLNRGKNVDPLYGEPDNDPLYGGTNPKSPAGTPQTHDLSWNFCPDVAQGETPLVIPCLMEYVEYDNRQPSVRPEGKIVEYEAFMSIAKIHWICVAEGLGVPCLIGRVPKEGDVAFSLNEWWDVVKVGSAGAILSTGLTVGYRIDLRKRSQFVPERKVDL